MSGSTARIFGLDVLRATAILLVLISHSTLLIFPDSTNYLVFIAQFFGTIGVDIFFVLSGFLIGRILLNIIEKQCVSLNTMLMFWIRRWFRTLPNYYLILIINIILYYFYFGEIIEETGLYFLFLQNFYGPQASFFTESWTLSIEEFAYILGPLILLVLTLFYKKIRKRHFVGMVIAVLCLFMFNRLIFNFNQDEYALIEWSRNLRKVVIYRIDAIYIGFLGAYMSIYFSYYWSKYRKQSLLLGVLLFFGMHGLMAYYSLQPAVSSWFYNILYLPLVSWCILCCFPICSLWTNGKYFRDVVTKISKWSYSIYLVNYSIILLGIVHYIKVTELNITLKILVLLLFWSLTLLISYLLFTYFEMPIMKLRDHPSIKKKLETFKI